MPKTSYHHGDLRNALIAEAGQMLEEDGVTGLSLRAVARRLGVSHAAPGHHFADRDALLCEVAAVGFIALSDGLEEAIERGGDVMLGAGVAYAEVALAHPQRFKLMFANSFLSRDDCPPYLQEQSSRAYMALLRVARGDAALDVDPANYTMGVPEFTTWAMIHGAATLFLDGALGPVDTDEAFRKLVVGMLRSVTINDDAAD